MLGLWPKVRSIIRQESKISRQYFHQYVGDNTVLMFGSDELFIYLDGNDAGITPSMIYQGTWETSIARWIDSQLPVDGCFVDIGANNGIHALRARRKVGADGTVIAFEPQQRLVGLIERSSSANSMIYNLHPRCMAIGASEGTARLGKFAHLTGSASMTANALFSSYEDVPLASLPAALAQVSHEIGKPCVPDVIKIDVEGFEYDVWDGMKEWTRQLPKLAIAIEYSPVSYRDNGRDPLKLLEEFIEYGFVILMIEEGGMTTPVDHSQLPAIAGSNRQYDMALTKG